DARDSGKLVASAEHHGSVFSFQIARHNRAVIAAGVTDIADVQIEMIAPKKRWNSERLARAENVARRSLPLPLSHHPVLYPDAACARIGPARDIAGGKNFRYVRL